MASHQTKLQHLFLRAGFGETPRVINDSLSKSTDKVVDELFQASQSWRDIEYLPYPLEDREEKNLNGFQLLMMILKSFGEREELNSEWVFKMTYTKAVLRERMTFFWHNHFATSVPFGYLAQLQNNRIRKHALGKFSDLLHAISKDQAMIIYLNNQENHKSHPNENFAREVMELFSLGRGHYTEQDIKEAARAFTGWAVNLKGEYEFREKDHDSEEKEFLGKKGKFNGDDIINIILENRQTAKYITTKIYREFVNPDVNESRVEELSDLFFKNGYDISALMRRIFTSDWFYDDENIGCKIASPVELLVRNKKLIGLEFDKSKMEVELQKLLGQVLFFPPNVAGWKGGKTWIDSTTLMLRMSLPRLILRSSQAEFAAKPQFEMDPDKPIAKLKAEDMKADWKELVNHFSAVNENDLAEKLLENLIQTNNKNITPALIQPEKGMSKKESIIHITSKIMSLPDYQMI